MFRVGKKLNLGLTCQVEKLTCPYQIVDLSHYTPNINGPHKDTIMLVKRVTLTGLIFVVD